MADIIGSAVISIVKEALNGESVCDSLMGCLKGGFRCDACFSSTPPRRIRVASRFVDGARPRSDDRISEPKLEPSATERATTGDCHDCHNASGQLSVHRHAACLGSKEQVPFGTISITRQDRRTSGNSLCIKDYDAILDNARRLSLNISPQISPAQSTFSLPASSSTESSPRRSIIRGLNKLRFRRPDSNGSSKDDCPHCPHDSFRHRRTTHRLPCGHGYCTLAIRKIIKTAINSESNMPPGCCGKPVPGRLVEMVMSQEEQGALMDKMMFLDDTGLHTSSQRKGDHVAVGGQALPGTLSNHSAPQFDGSSLAQQEARQNLKRALDLPTFRQMREAQEAQRDRFSNTGTGPGGACFHCVIDGWYKEDAQRHQQHQRRLLHEFVHSSHGLISGAQRVTITGDISTSTSAAYEEIMTPRIVWAEAVGYDLVDLIETMKARYDKIADMYFHEWGVAWRVATLLLDLARDALDSFGIQLCGRTPGQAVPIPPWEQRIYILSFECILTSLTLAVRHNDYSLGPSAVHELHDRHRLRDLVQHLPTVLYTRILQFRALVELFFPNITTFANILDRHESAKASLELGLELMPEDDALTRDLAIVNAFISSQGTTPPLQYGNFSLANRHPVWRSQPQRTTRPKGLARWRNYNDELDKETEKTLRAWTRTHWRSLKQEDRWTSNNILHPFLLRLSLSLNSTELNSTVTSTFKRVGSFPGAARAEHGACPTMRATLVQLGPGVVTPTPPRGGRRGPRTYDPLRCASAIETHVALGTFQVMSSLEVLSRPVILLR
ncbi:hypothetical protein M8818_005390 [Zalaria obscura]|uniref:Uncharacterized protein n=1 Tax=Zalaria obscura TaxID=2024903 RepID=A0ACC3S8F9_9PEZI